MVAALQESGDHYVCARARDCLLACVRVQEGGNPKEIFFEIMQRLNSKDAVGGRREGDRPADRQWRGGRTGGNGGKEGRWWGR